MTASDIVPVRLANQQITFSRSTTPSALVSAMVAMQAQEFAMAKWAIGLRLNGIVEQEVDTAFNEGLILRTHLMRPTWHFVTPENIRWLLALTSPHVHTFNAYWYRKHGLDEKIFRKSRNVLIKSIEGGKHLTRAELKAALERSKIPVTTGEQFSLIMMHAELEGIICSGPRAGKQFTYALLDERAPVAGKKSSAEFDRDEALSELANRYFENRGPATISDFMWWSGLNSRDAKKAVASLSKKFIHELINGKEYLFSPSGSKIKKSSASTFLMPDYDEYGISYKDRSAIYNDEGNRRDGRENIIFNHALVIDGLIAGTWKRSIKKGIIDVETFPFKTFTKIKEDAVARAVTRYLGFVNC